MPEEKMQSYRRPEPTIPRAKSHHDDWVQAVRSGSQAGSNFDYGGPLTEIALLGVIATRLPDTKLQWDAQNMRFTNCDEANRFLQPYLRDGWAWK